MRNFKGSAKKSKGRFGYPFQKIWDSWRYPLQKWFEGGIWSETLDSELLEELYGQVPLPLPRKCRKLNVLLYFCTFLAFRDLQSSEVMIMYPGGNEAFLNKFPIISWPQKDFLSLSEINNAICLAGKPLKWYVFSVLLWRTNLAYDRRQHQKSNFGSKIIRNLFRNI